MSIFTTENQKLPGRKVSGRIQRITQHTRSIIINFENKCLCQRLELCFYGSGVNNLCRIFV